MKKNETVANQNEKPKLSVVKTSSWHWRLNTWVLGRKIMNPSMFANLCLYFWLSFTSVVLSPFWLLGHLILVWPINWIIKLDENYTKKQLESYVEVISDEQAYELFARLGNESELLDLPKKLKNKRYELLNEWKKSKGLEDHSALVKFMEGIKEKRDTLAKLKRQARAETRAVRESKNRKSEQRIEAMWRMIDKIFTPFANFYEILKRIFTFDSAGKVMMAAKKITGALITLALFVGVYFIVQAFVALILLIIESWNGAMILEFLILLGSSILAVTITSIIVLGIDTLYKRQQKKYRKGDPIAWWAKIFIAIWKVIRGFGVYVIGAPIYFIFKSFLWDFVVISLIWGGLKSFGNAFIIAGGVFGDYFGRSYGDYCPGIEVVDDKQKSA